jgi:hypothetical protein
MLQRKLLMLVLMSVLVVPASFALAADQERTQQQIQSQMQEQVYGSQLMTPQERAEYHANMRAAKTEEKCKQIRNEHHERMKERAKKLNVVLPDKPPNHGMGRGMGSGAGMGPRGGGMGPGGGRNR